MSSQKCVLKNISIFSKFSIFTLKKKLYKGTIQAQLACLLIGDILDSRNQAGEYSNKVFLHVTRAACKNYVEKWILNCRSRVKQ